MKEFVIQDDTPLSTCGLTNGAQLMMMGTALGGELKKPEATIKFVEDMTAEERAKALHEKTGQTLPAGLENLGNTCYMNSTVQCLKRVNELKEALQNYQDSSLQGGFDSNRIMTKAAKELFKNLDFKGEPFAPFGFVQAMRQVFPQFNETDDHGHHKQQDAEEFYTALLTAFKNSLKLSEEEGGSDLIEKLFGLELVNSLQNKEVPDEPV